MKINRFSLFYRRNWSPTKLVRMAFDILFLEIAGNNAIRVLGFVILTFNSRRS
jgi:hypothetical protein